MEAKQHGCPRGKVILTFVIDLPGPRRVSPASLGLVLDNRALDILMSDPSTREQAALVAYARELFRRCGGAYTGPWVLALWRMFAWLPSGSPKHDFELTPKTILDAEKALSERFSTLSSKG